MGQIFKERGSALMNIDARARIYIHTLIALLTLTIAAFYLNLGVLNPIITASISVEHRADSFILHACPP
jgi:hypothetical protein